MKKAYFCIDGFSFKRINDFYKYEHKRRSRLNIAAMETYLRYEIERRFEWKSDLENLEIEKHFYHPNENPLRDFYGGEVKELIRKFEKSLVEFGYAVHYAKCGNVLSPKPNENIFSDWMIASELRKYDIFALLSTQGQYASILRQTRLCEIPSILIGWDSVCRNSAGESSLWKTDKTLIGYANAFCPLDKTLNQSGSKHPFVDIMFEKFFSSGFRPFASSPRYPLSQQCG